MKKNIFSFLLFAVLMVGANSIANSQCLATYSFQTGANGSVYFTPTSTSGNSYFWIMGNGATVNTSGSHMYTYSSNGTFIVYVSVLDSVLGCNQSNNIWCDTIVVTNAGGNPASCQAGFYIFPDSTLPAVYYGVNTSTGTGLNYTWNWGDGSTSTGAYPTHTYSTSGTYSVCLIIANSNCSDSFCLNYFVARMNGANAAMHSINFVDPNNPTAVKELPAVANVKVFPVPASDYLTIETANFDIKKVIVRDATGRICGSSKMNGKQLDISELPEGVYILEVNTAGKTSHTKFVKVALR